MGFPLLDDDRARADPKLCQRSDPSRAFFNLTVYLFAGTTEVLFFILRPASAAHCSIWGTYSVARGSELQSQEDNPTDVSYERFELG